METGFATRIMRLSTSAAMATSPCWAGNPRARSFGPMIALYLPTAVSASETAPAVAGHFLPGHAALLCDDPNVAIALALRLGVLRARHRRRTRRDDNVRRWIGLVVGDGLVHRLAIIGTVRQHGRNLALDRLEQCRRLTGVIGSIV